MADAGPAPRDVAALRRDLHDWTRDHGALYYHQAIALGRQAVRPAGPAHRVAELLAAHETLRLEQADLWYLDHDLCDLLTAAHPTMPRFAPTPPDLPSRWGFAVFATPIDTRSPRAETGLADFATAVGVDDPSVLDLPIQISAASWGPVELADTPDTAPAGAVWISFYARSRIERLTDGMPDDHRARARAALPPLLVDNEAVVPWTPTNPTDPDRWLLPQAGTTDSTHGWAATLFAAFRLALQPGLADTTTARPDRPERRRAARAGLPERDVRIVRLRHGHGDGGSGARGEYHHRWVVRGHWRQQPWGPGRQHRHPTWILPHVKGPDGAPLLGGDRVTVATAPPEEAPDA